MGLKKQCDTLKIDGKIYYAWGEYRNDSTGLKYANLAAKKMRKLGASARIIKRSTGCQVYTDKIDVVDIDSSIPILKKRTTQTPRTFYHKGRAYRDDGFEVYRDYTEEGDREEYNSRDSRYKEDW